MIFNRVVIVDRPNLCGYYSVFDLIVISKCYYDDPELFSFLLEHEQRHRRIQNQHGYLGVFHHIILDWKFRFSLMKDEKASEYYSRYLNLSEKKDFIMMKEFLSNIIYIILTIPTIIFQVFSCLGILRRR